MHINALQLVASAGIPAHPAAKKKIKKSRSKSQKGVVHFFFLSVIFV